MIDVLMFDEKSTIDQISTQVNDRIEEIEKYQGLKLKDVQVTAQHNRGLNNCQRLVYTMSFEK